MKTITFLIAGALLFSFACEKGEDDNEDKEITYIDGKEYLIGEWRLTECKTTVKVKNESIEAKEESTPCGTVMYPFFYDANNQYLYPVEIEIPDAIVFEEDRNQFSARDCNLKVKDFDFTGIRYSIEESSGFIDLPTSDYFGHKQGLTFHLDINKPNMMTLDFVMLYGIPNQPAQNKTYVHYCLYEKE